MRILLAIFLGLAAVAPGAGLASGLPEGAYAALASGAGTTAFFDSGATGGAIFLANAAAPFAEAIVQTGPSSEGTASYLYDRNAVTGLYAIGSSASQQPTQPPDQLPEDLKGPWRETVGAPGPAFPDLQITAASRYPGVEHAEAGHNTDYPVVLGVQDGPSAGMMRVRQNIATADSDAGSTRTDVRTGGLDITVGTDLVFAAGAQLAESASNATEEGVRADSVIRVTDVSIAGGLVEIEEIRSESHAIVEAGKNHAATTFLVAGATVGGVPVTIGSDGVRAADARDTTAPGVVDAINHALSDALKADGVSIALLAPSTSEEDGARASTPGLAIRIQRPSVSGVPDNVVELTLGRTSANASFTPYPPPIVLPVTIIAPIPPRAVTSVELIPGSGPAPAGPEDTTESTGGFVRAQIPPALALFVLWQLSSFGAVAMAYWMRMMPRGVRPS